MIRNNKYGTGLATLALTLALASQVSAQEALQDAAEGVIQIDEIIVTAQRRAESKQDVPVTITVLDSASIERARIHDAQDVSMRTPGFGFDAWPATEPRLSVRGIGTTARGAGGDPSTAVFYDEIYAGRPAAITFETYDLQRIEVLKGPQGTLYGRNVTGGAISVVSNPADLSGFDASAEGSYGNFDRTDLQGYVNVPLSDKVAVRATGTWRRHDGYVSRIVNGSEAGKLDDQNTKYGRFQVYAEPSENVRIDLKADIARDRANGPGFRAFEDAGVGGLSGRYILVDDRSVNASTFDGIQSRDAWGLRGKLELDLSFATLSYLGAYRELDYYSYYDYDGTAPSQPGLGGPRDIAGGNTEESEYYSHEVQLSSLPDSDFKWVLGLYNYHIDTHRDNLSELSVFLGGPPTFTDFIDQYADATSYAAYGDVTVPVSDTVNVFGGLRYTVDKKRVLSIGNTNAPGTFFIEEPTGSYEGTGSDKWDALTWRFGADVHLTSDLMVYASVSRGYKSGGFQDTPIDAIDAATSFNPEYATNFEVGQRGTFFNRRVVFNNSLYFTKYKDLQVRIPTGTGVRAENAQAEIWGLESELTWRVSNGLTLSAIYAYTHDRLTKFDTEEYGIPVSYAGNRLTRIPAHKVVISPSYTLELSSGADLELSVDYAYESKIFDDFNNQPPEIRASTNFVDARAVFTTVDEQWSVSLWGKNLTNELTRTYQSDFGGVNFGAYNAPRTYGVSLRWKY
ncbi:TonB-dependent receptor [Kordiimonas pumila]|uniref:TonB-dependent receptor n=1 Tax=Kordiimonas pumila TaxID=2161677 RepID=A0ABV7D2N3_9PROT|nr:TonB-dependent receptor [Kordiimonas pumila]